MLRVVLTVLILAALLAQLRLMLRTGLAGVFLCATALAGLYVSTAWRSQLPAVAAFVVWWLGWACGIVDVLKWLEEHGIRPPVQGSKE